MANKTLSELDEFLASLEKIPADYTQALKEVRDLAQEATRQNFEGEHGPDGVPWVELKAGRFVHRRARERRPQRQGRRFGKKLVYTGEMKASFQGGAGHVEEIAPTRLEWGTDIEYAGFHQEGAPRANIPIREMVGFSESSQEKIDDLLADDVEGKVLEIVDAFAL